ncbi:MAG: von Willebrand factor type A domain-containing protein, partial [Acidimicrobiia bacterium]|nr:von Willebrand factor type A domain-containing protein [Acidimicrobiia bacterium]
VDLSGPREEPAEAMADSGSASGAPQPMAAEEPMSDDFITRRPCRICEPNTFQDYGVNPFVDTSDDPLSTFALDVDTASYTVARNFLDSGQLPPIDAVRTEEFVNYFDGGYEDVRDEFTVNLEAAPSPFADPDHVLLRVGIQAPRELSQAAAPDSVVLVMDRSGSMDEPTGSGPESMRRITLAHRAVELLISGLPRETRVGVVAYESRSATVLEPTVIEGNAKWIMDNIRAEVTPGGSTNAESGLVRGYNMALDEAHSGRQVLVLLLSDGVANVGATRTDDILESIGERADIGLSTIGVGLGPFNDELMEQLANRADGTYHYIDTPSEAVRVFVDDLDGLVAYAARDAKVQVDFNPDVVRSYRLLGFENRDIDDESFRDDTQDAGEIGIGHSSTALYELELFSRTRDDRSALATVRMRYERPTTGTIVELATHLPRSAVERSFDAATPHFRLAAVAAEFAEVLRASPYAPSRIPSELQYQADAIADDLPRDADAAELASLIETARRLLR